MESASSLSFNKVWDSVSLRAVLPEQMSQKIADFGKSYFKNFSFAYLKESRWTYIVVGGIFFIACLVKISRLSNQLLKKQEEIDSLKADLQKEIAFREALQKEMAAVLELSERAVDTSERQAERFLDVSRLSALNHSTGSTGFHNIITDDFVPSTEP